MYSTLLGKLGHTPLDSGALSIHIETFVKGYVKLSFTKWYRKKKKTLLKLIKKKTFLAPRICLGSSWDMTLSGLIGANCGTPI